MKLEEIVGYLPFKLMAYDERQEQKTDIIVGMFHNSLDFENWSPLDLGKLENYKIVLHPLSDLKKPCLEGGKIPIVELAKIESRDRNWVLGKIGFVEWYCSYGKFTFNITIFQGRILSVNHCLNMKHVQCNNIVEIFQKLYEWHFDIYGLIERGEAIDINTLT